jgi:hypothetical protein
MARGVEELLSGELSHFRSVLSFSIGHETIVDLPPALSSIRNQSRVGFAWFSDTVLLYSLDDDDLSCRNVLETVGWLLFTTMSSQTRIRAGIAYGAFYADAANELYIGPALVEAYELEQAQTWAGAALTNSAASRVPDRNSTGQRFQWWVCQYPVPLKEAASVSCSNLVVDWTQGEHERTDFQWSPSHSEPTMQERDANKGRYEKWFNTRRFHREICIRCFPDNRTRDELKVI